MVGRDRDQPGGFSMSTEAAFDSTVLIQLLKALQQGQARTIGSLLLAHRRRLMDLTNVLIKERLAVQVFAVLNQLNLRTLFPRASWSLLEDQWQGQQQRNTTLLRELIRIEQVFDGAGMPWLYMKGLSLGDRFYGGADRRFTWDLDLLVRPEDLSRTFVLLAPLGFHRPRGLPGMDRIAQGVTHALECRRHDGLSLDLHWTFRRLPGLRLNHRAVWRDRASLTLGGVAIPVPSDEHQLLQVLLGITADLDRGLCRLRALWDVYMMLRGLGRQDWRGFLARRQSEKTLPLVANALALVVNQLECHAEFPSLLEALEEHRDVLAIQDPSHARRILGRGPHGFANRLLYSRWQPLPRRLYWPWWVATLPMRFLVARRL